MSVSLALATFLAPHESPDPGNGVVKGTGHALLQRNNGIVSDVDVFGTDLRTAFGDVAQANAEGILELAQAVCCIEGMHGQGSDAHHEAWSGKVVAPMVTQHMTDVLAQEAFNALVELLQTIDIILLHAVCTIGLTRLRGEGLDAFVDFVVA